MNNQVVKLLTVISDIFEMPEKKILAKTNQRDITTVRNVYHKFLSEDFDLKTAATARVTGWDRTSVMHSIKVYNNLMDTDHSFQKDIDRLYRRLSHIELVYVPRDPQGYSKKPGDESKYYLYNNFVQVPPEDEMKVFINYVKMNINMVVIQSYSITIKDEIKVKVSCNKQVTKSAINTFREIMTTVYTYVFDCPVTINVNYVNKTPLIEE